MPDSKINIAVVDDHQLFREGLIRLIHQLNATFQVRSESQHGKELLEKLKEGLKVDLIILDLNMPIMNGYTTVKHLQSEQQGNKCLVLTMNDDDITLIKLIKAGASGFLNKDAEPEELQNAILAIHKQGYYYPATVADKLVGALRNPNGFDPKQNQLNDQELKFLELACSEYTYKEIADIMCLSIKTIDGYRARLFEKLEVKSRVGLVLFAVRNKMVKVD